MRVRIAVVTVSDRCAAGLRKDESGALLADWVREAGHELAAREMVPDDSDRLAQLLTRLADEGVADVILTTGGTGLGPRDLTPEATRAVIERDVPGISEAIRQKSRTKTERAVLSRAVAGTRAASLIVNLPGSPSGATDGVAALAPILEHAVSLLRDEETDH